MAILLILMLVGLFPHVVFSKEWIQVDAGDPLPSQSFSGGTKDEDGNTIYVCRLGNMGCGHTNANPLVCKVAYDNQEHINTSFDILTAPPKGATYELRWSEETFGSGNVPLHAVQAATDMFVGRHNEGNHFLLGKVDKERHGFYATKNGRHYYKKWGYQVLVNSSRPIESYEILNVNYDFSRATLTYSPEQVSLSHATVKNDSPYDTVSKLSMDYEQKQTSKWSINDTLEMHMGLKVTVTARIPFLVKGEGEWEAGISNTFTYTSGESITTKTKTTHDVNINLPGYSNVNVTMVAKIATANLSYSATVKVHYEDGQTSVLEGVKGLFLNVYYEDFDTTVKAAPLEPNKMSGWAIAAIVILPVAALMTCIIYFLYKRWKKTRNEI